MPIDPTNQITVKAALNHASHGWKRLPEWLSAAYEDGRVLFLPKQVQILNKNTRHWRTAEYNDVLEFRHGKMVIRRPLHCLYCNASSRVTPCAACVEREKPWAEASR